MSALAGRCFTEGIDPRKKNQRCHPRRAESTARPRTPAFAECRSRLSQPPSRCRAPCALL